MNELTLYTTTWCPFCQRLTSDLDAAGVTYVNIDVDEDEAAGEWVKSVNDGNRIVPTVKYPDGSHATNPRARAVIRKLDELAGSRSVGMTRITPTTRYEMLVAF